MNTTATFKVLGICGSLRQKSLNLAALKATGELMQHRAEISTKRLGLQDPAAMSRAGRP